jgi:hypothetical protein
LVFQYSRKTRIDEYVTPFSNYSVMTNNKNSKIRWKDDRLKLVNISKGLIEALQDAQVLQ